MAIDTPTSGNVVNMATRCTTPMEARASSAPMGFIAPYFTSSRLITKLTTRPLRSGSALAFFTALTTSDGVSSKASSLKSSGSRVSSRGENTHTGAPAGDFRSPSAASTERSVPAPAAALMRSTRPWLSAAPTARSVVVTSVVLGVLIHSTPLPAACRAFHWSATACGSVLTIWLVLAPVLITLPPTGGADAGTVADGVVVGLHPASRAAISRGINSERVRGRRRSIGFSLPEGLFEREWFVRQPRACRITLTTLRRTRNDRSLPCHPRR